MKKKTLNTLIITGIIAVVIIIGFHAGGNLMDMIRHHMGI